MRPVKENCLCYSCRIRILLKNVHTCKHEEAIIIGLIMALSEKMGTPVDLHFLNANKKELKKLNKKLKNIKKDKPIDLTDSGIKTHGL